MSTDEIVKLFKELGFPAAVAAFVLWRLEARLREMVAALGAVRETLATIVRQGAEAKHELEKHIDGPPPSEPPDRRRGWG